MAAPTGKTTSYRILEKLGEGGMGVVYLATQTSLDRPVALKLLTPGARENSSFVSRFFREVQASSKVSHPNIIKILDYGQIGDQPFYAMEYIDAPTLERHARRRGPAGADELVAIGRQLADALACMHREGLVHRDLKPSNVMIDASGHVTLMDFGLVKDLAGTAMTAAGKIVGTPAYLAPETIRGQAPDGRADLFSLGVLLWELATGTKPFQRDSLQALLVAIMREPHEPSHARRPDLPAWLGALIDRLLAKDRDDRFPSARAVVRALQRGQGEAVPEDADADSVDMVRAFDGPADPPVSSGVIEGGIAALARAPVRAAPRPTERPRVLRPTARVPAARPAGSPRTSGRRVPVALWVLAAAAALALALVPRPPGPVASPAPVVAPRASATAPATPLEIGAALARALDRVRPLERIAEVHAALVAAAPTKRGWFDPVAPPEIQAVRDGARARFDELDRASALSELLAAFAPVRAAYFASAPPLERWALYAKLHELVDLDLWCARARIAFAFESQGALPLDYGQLASPRLANAPGFAYRFALGEKYVPKSLALLDPGPGIEQRTLTDTERYFGPGDSREGDLITGIENASRSRYDWRSPEPVPLPPAAELAELELFAAAADLADNHRFVVSSIENGRPARDIAILRGRGAALRPVVHTVERALLGAGPWRLAIRLKIVPDMMAWTEYANLPMVGFRYRRKR